MSGLYNQISSAASQRGNSPNVNMRNNFDADSQYLTELLAEHQKLGPFMQVLPLCTRLLNQEILRVSGKNGYLQNQGFSNFDRMQSPSYMASPEITQNFTGWNSLSHENSDPLQRLEPLEEILATQWPGMKKKGREKIQGGTGGVWSSMTKIFSSPSSNRRGSGSHIRLAGLQGLNVDWQTAPVVPNSHIVKKILRLDIPKDSYPNFNFVGRLLGPRGNSLKRVEATTGCRVFIRGKGSIKDLDKEEFLRGRPGYEHLNEPLYILIEAELPANVIDLRLRQAQEIIEELLKPVDESQDFYKRQQLRELAMLNSNFREESPQPQLSGSVSPFTSNEIKRAKTDH